ncbi:hypothetical protein [Streptomyces sp. NPDC057966]|uniref:hypothetical protein n=1 Tax=Streptomyces sp. NPDC057966 TaxID=3346292 RepID=UPI0036E676C5
MSGDAHARLIVFDNPGILAQIGPMASGRGDDALMAWDEWEHLKADAATRSSRMRLNRHPAGCRSAAAQKELCASWSECVRNVRERCKSSGGLLKSSGHDLSKTDESLKAELDAIKAEYTDTPAVGGRPKGK